MKTVTLSSKNQIVIPSAVRARMSVQSGDRLIISHVTDTQVVLKKEPSFRELIGTVPKQSGDPVARIRKIRDNWR
ncbi:MAG: AbrB/MazE/SpoVT family DNA-binding domain-containing protein [Candidatus Saccharimonadales bacterium]